MGIAAAAVLLDLDTDRRVNATAFLGAHAAFGIDQIRRVYPTCVEQTNDGRLRDTGALCALDFIGYSCGIVASLGAVNIIGKLLSSLQECC
jgi:hypothetical protein